MAGTSLNLYAASVIMGLAVVTTSSSVLFCMPTRPAVVPEFRYATSMFESVLLQTFAGTGPVGATVVTFKVSKFFLPWSI